MPRKQDADTRYFLDVNLETMKIIRWDYDQKQYLNKGKSPGTDVHRVFLTVGQYNKFISRIPR